MFSYYAEKSEFNDIREKSVAQWLDEMSNHDDITVRGGVKVTRDYISFLQSQIELLKSENELKNTYLKKLKGKI